MSSSRSNSGAIPAIEGCASGIQQGQLGVSPASRPVLQYMELRTARSSAGLERLVQRPGLATVDVIDPSGTPFTAPVNSVESQLSVRKKKMAVRVDGSGKVRALDDNRAVSDDVFKKTQHNEVVASPGTDSGWRIVTSADRRAHQKFEPDSDCTTRMAPSACRLSSGRRSRPAKRASAGKRKLVRRCTSIESRPPPALPGCPLFDRRQTLEATRLCIRDSATF